ncbi:MAG: NAD(P)/FAD-dependent oxidoreductase [Bacillota bacterium]
MRHVIIGNSAAGVKAAETIRALDPCATITIISDEAAPVYSRCLLPDYLSGTRSGKGLMFRSKNFYTEHGISTMLGCRVTRVLTPAKEVEFSDGRKLPYDKLLIATGSSTAYPPVPGLQGKDVFGLRTINDARGIVASLPETRRVVVVGAGFVGLETALALYRRGLEVTVVERFPQVLPQQFDSRAAAILQRELQAEGIRFILGQGIKEVAGPSIFQRLFQRQGRGVVLEGGDYLKSEMIIVAAGTRTNTEFLQDSGIEVARGILVDRFMGTSAPDVFAAGDVAETVDAVTGERGLSPIWPNAMSQGKVAGFNMAGFPRVYSPLIGMQNAVEFRAVPAVAIGITRPVGEEYEVFSLFRPERNLYKKVVLKDNRIVGLIMVGDISRAGVYAALIKKQSDISSVKHKLLSDDFSYASARKIPA